MLQLSKDSRRLCANGLIWDCSTDRCVPYPSSTSGERACAIIDKGNTQLANDTNTILLRFSTQLMDAWLWDRCGKLRLSSPARTDSPASTEPSLSAQLVCLRQQTPALRSSLLQAINWLFTKNSFLEHTHLKSKYLRMGLVQTSLQSLFTIVYLITYSPATSGTAKANLAVLMENLSFSHLHRCKWSK